MLEEDLSKYDSKKDLERQGSSGSGCIKENENEIACSSASIEIQSDLNLSKVDLHPPKINVSIKEEIEDALNKAVESDDTEECPTPDLPDNSSGNTEFHTAQLVSPQKACIVELHHIDWGNKEEQDNGESKFLKFNNYLLNWECSATLFHQDKLEFIFMLRTSGKFQQQFMSLKYWSICQQHKILNIY